MPLLANRMKTVSDALIFTLQPGTTEIVVALGAASALLLAVLYRPLLLSSLSPDLAAARGVPVRVVGTGFLLALALAVSLSAVTIGAILSTALLVGPAAAALRVTSRPGAAIAVAAAFGVAAAWVGTLIAYDSTVWLGGRGVPVSFCIVAVIFVGYAASSLAGRARTSRYIPLPDCDECVAGPTVPTVEAR